MALMTNFQIELKIKNNDISNKKKEEKMKNFPDLHK